MTEDEIKEFLMNMPHEDILKFIEIFREMLAEDLSNDICDF